MSNSITVDKLAPKIILLPLIKNGDIPKNTPNSIDLLTSNTLKLQQNMIKENCGILKSKLLSPDLSKSITQTNSRASYFVDSSIKATKPNSPKRLISLTAKLPPTPVILAPKDRESSNIKIITVQKSDSKSISLVVGRKVTNELNKTKLKSTGNCVICFEMVNDTNSIRINVSKDSFTQFGVILKLVLDLSKCELSSNLCCTSCSSRVMHTFNDWLDINVLAILKDEVKSYRHRICEDCKFSLPTLEAFTDHLLSHIVTGKPLNTQIVIHVSEKSIQKKPPKNIENNFPEPKTLSHHVNKGILNKTKAPLTRRPLFRLTDGKNVVYTKNLNNALLNAGKNLQNSGNPKKAIVGVRRDQILVRNPGKGLTTEINLLGIGNIPNTIYKNTLPVKKEKPQQYTTIDEDVILIKETAKKKINTIVVKSHVRVASTAKIPSSNEVVVIDEAVLLNSDVASNDDNSTENTSNVSLSNETSILNSESIISSSYCDIPNPENVVISKDILKKNPYDLLCKEILDSDIVMTSENGDIPNPENVTISEEIAKDNSGDEDNTMITEEVPRDHFDCVANEDGDVINAENAAVSEEIPTENSDDMSNKENEILNPDDEEVLHENDGMITEEAPRENFEDEEELHGNDGMITEETPGDDADCIENQDVGVTNSENVTITEETPRENYEGEEEVHENDGMITEETARDDFDCIENEDVGVTNSEAVSITDETPRQNSEDEVEEHGNDGMITEETPINDADVTNSEYVTITDEIELSNSDNMANEEGNETNLENVIINEEIPREDSNEISNEEIGTLIVDNEMVVEESDEEDVMIIEEI